MIGETVKIKKSQVFAAINAFRVMGSTPMQPQAAYWLQRNLSQLTPIAKQMENQKFEIIKRLGVKKDDGYEIPDTIGEGEDKKPNPVLKQANDELAAAFNEEVEATINKVSVSGFVQVSVEVLNALEFMIDEPVNSSNIVKLQR